MLVGKAIGPFVVEKEIGGGAMGSVYRARHAESGKCVAIKIVATALTANETVMQRFEREWEILKRLKHPHIVRLLATGRYSGMPFYAMEFVEGESCDKLIARRGRLGWEEVVQIGRQLCDALQHAHEKGIIHRDLKPSNLMILPDGTVKLTDFGIAKDLDRTAITEANCTVGTASYMSPEQCRGEPQLTPKSDLYSMGVMFYELLTGKKPFQAESAMDMFMQHVKGKFERPSRLVMEIPVFLDTLVCQLMEKKPARRPYSAEMVAEALGRVAEKVATQQSAGMDAVLSGQEGMSMQGPALVDGDRDAAQALSAKKRKKRRATEHIPFFKRLWFKGAMLGSALAVLAGLFAAVWLIKPSPEALFKSAAKIMKSGNLEKQVEARTEGAIHRFLRYYDDRDDEQSRTIADWADDIDVRECERLLHKRRKFNIEVEDYELECRKAVEAEDSGNLQKARLIWIRLVKYKDEPRKPEPSEKRSFGLLAQNKLAVLDEVNKREQALLKLAGKDGANKDYQPADEYEKLAAEAFKLEQQNSEKAKKAWEDLQNSLNGEGASMRAWRLLAAKRLLGLNEKGKGQDVPQKMGTGI